jgi:peptidoglycan/LPS O-acetylase OafA/YrhL
MLSILVRAEQFGLVFWIVSLFLLNRRKAVLVMAWHCVALCLSFLAPVYAATRSAEADTRTLVAIWLLALLNGLLGAVWCSRLEPRASPWPTLGITLAGAVGSLVLALEGLAPTRLF